MRGLTELKRKKETRERSLEFFQKEKKGIIRVKQFIVYEILGKRGRSS